MPITSGRCNGASPSAKSITASTIIVEAVIDLADGEAPLHLPEVMGIYQTLHHWGEEPRNYRSSMVMFGYFSYQQIFSTFSHVGRAMDHSVLCEGNLVYWQSQPAI